MRRLLTAACILTLVAAILEGAAFTQRASAAQPPTFVGRPELGQSGGGYLNR